MAEGLPEQQFDEGPPGYPPVPAPTEQANLEVRFSPLIRITASVAGPGGANALVITAGLTIIVGAAVTIGAGAIADEFVTAVVASLVQFVIGAGLLALGLGWIRRRP